jgi:hypothetical protein
LIEKKRLGYEDKDPVRGVFLGVMTDQGSGEMREQANAMKGVFGNLQCSNLVDFLYHLRWDKEAEEGCWYEKESISVQL